MKKISAFFAALLAGSFLLAEKVMAAGGVQVKYGVNIGNSGSDSGVDQFAYGPMIQTAYGAGNSISFKEAILEILLSPIAFVIYAILAVGVGILVVRRLKKNQAKKGKN